MNAKMVAEHYRDELITFIPAPEFDPPASSIQSTTAAVIGTALSVLLPRGDLRPHGAHAMVQYRISVDGKEHEAQLHEKRGEDLVLLIDGVEQRVTVRTLLPNYASGSSAGQSTEIAGSMVVAPMPGIIVQISKKVGDTVKLGETLLVMEAMKMENNLPSPRAGKVKSILVSPGAEVQAQQALVELE